MPCADSSPNPWSSLNPTNSAECAKRPCTENVNFNFQIM